jgi:hypothetical protein
MPGFAPAGGMTMKAEITQHDAAGITVSVSFSDDQFDRGHVYKHLDFATDELKRATFTPGAVSTHMTPQSWFDFRQRCDILSELAEDLDALVKSVDALKNTIAIEMFCGHISIKVGGVKNES